MGGTPNLVLLPHHCCVDLQGYLLTCALDGSVKVWAPCETPQPNAVLESTPNYSHPSSSDSGQVHIACVGQHNEPNFHLL